jgi:hypothetical protein
MPALDAVKIHDEVKSFAVFYGMMEYNMYTEIILLHRSALNIWAGRKTRVHH